MKETLKGDLSRMIESLPQYRSGLVSSADEEKWIGTVLDRWSDAPPSVRKRYLDPIEMAKKLGRISCSEIGALAACNEGKNALFGGDPLADFIREKRLMFPPREVIPSLMRESLMTPLVRELTMDGMVHPLIRERDAESAEIVARSRYTHPSGLYVESVPGDVVILKTPNGTRRRILLSYKSGEPQEGEWLDPLRDQLLSEATLAEESGVSIDATMIVWFDPVTMNLSVTRIPLDPERGRYLIHEVAPWAFGQMLSGAIPSVSPITMMPHDREMVLSAQKMVLFRSIASEMDSLADLEKDRMEKKIFPFSPGLKQEIPEAGVMATVSTPRKDAILKNAGRIMAVVGEKWLEERDPEMKMSFETVRMALEGVPDQIKKGVLDRLPKSPDLDALSERLLLLWKEGHPGSQALVEEICPRLVSIGRDKDSRLVQKSLSSEVSGEVSSLVKRIGEAVIERLEKSRADMQDLFSDETVSAKGSGDAPPPKKTSAGRVPSMF